MSYLSRLYSDYGQSIWLDYIDRDLLVNGGLKNLVDQGLRGVTSNPTIFYKAITAGSDYDDAIRDLIQADHRISAHQLYEWLAINDVQDAADILRPVYDSSEGRDGFVSLEVSPHLAYDAEASIGAAEHLWRAVDRPNLMIKIPATVEGLRAFEVLIMQGINVNVTLLFSVRRYKAVVDTYLRGLSMNPNPRDVASVASFFVSRVDSKVDARLEALGSPEAQRLKGRIAIANAKQAYRYFREVSESAPYRAQLERGARLQRPLWASTRTKNPQYSDVLYVEELIGRDTVNTLTPQTLDALQVHADLAHTLERDVDNAAGQLERLAALGIDLEQVADELEREGIEKFVASHDQLLAALQAKSAAIAKEYAY